MHTVKAKKLTRRTASFDDTVREKEHSVTGMQKEAYLVIRDVGEYANRQATRNGNLLTVEIRRQMTRIGYDKLAVWAEPCRLACSEAVAADHCPVQRLQNSGGTMHIHAA